MRRPRVWSVRTPDPSLERTLSQGLSIAPITARVLRNRGVHSVDVGRRFLKAEIGELETPDVFPTMEHCVQRLQRALDQGERVVVYGDYDVDGLTGACLLVHFLRALGGQADIEIPDRLHEGYGLNPTGVARVLANPPAVLVTVDHGVTAYEAVARLQNAGIDVIVTDHHQKPDVLPESYGLLNPLLLGEEGEAVRYLSGAGVAFKLACALFQALPSDARRNRRVREVLRDCLAFAALGTVADLVPLVGENRLIVRHGLQRLEVTTMPGLSALRDVAGLKDRALDTEDVSFQLAPRLNAAGRCGRVEVARDLLLTQSLDQASALARELGDLNVQRRELEARVNERATALADARPAEEPVLCLADESFHTGVLGIVASRLVERHGKPTFLISVDDAVGRGSGRSVAGFDLARSLRAVGHCLRSHGGHAAAAGLEMDPARVDELRDALCQYHADLGLIQEPSILDIDAEVQLHQITPRLIRELTSVAPFGQGNPRPVFASSRVEHAAPPRRVGVDGAHLLMKLRYPNRPVSAIAFRQGHRIEEAKSGDLSLVFSASRSTFPGGAPVELRVMDLRTDETTPKDGSATE